jgi:fimbrial chaperone protein
MLPNAEKPNRKEGCPNWLAYLLSLVLMLFPLFAQAGSFSVNPIRVEITAPETTSSLQLSNKDSQAVVVQTSVVKWTQKDGKDVYTKTDGVIVTPPIVSIAPHDSQMLRVGLMRPCNPSEETSYRVLIKEIPPKIKRIPGIHFALQISMPIFIMPAEIHNSLQWSASKKGPQNLAIRLVNNGNTHIQVTRIKVYQQQQTKPLFMKDIFSYVLPRQAATLNFKLPQPISGNSIKIVATTDRGEISENVALVST